MLIYYIYVIIHMGRRRIHTVIDEELYIKFATAALRKFRGQRGYIARALEEAVRLWIEENQQD